MLHFVFDLPHLMGHRIPFMLEYLSQSYVGGEQCIYQYLDYEAYNVCKCKIMVIEY